MVFLFLLQQTQASSPSTAVKQFLARQGSCQPDGLFCSQLGCLQLRLVGHQLGSTTISGSLNIGFCLQYFPSRVHIKVCFISQAAKHEVICCIGADRSMVINADTVADLICTQTQTGKTKLTSVKLALGSYTIDCHDNASVDFDSKKQAATAMNS